jgi:glycosyltransferase involved in cell wall biosynthesis
MNTAKPGQSTVGIWKNSWLAPSETFVRDQVRALSEWRPVLVGLSKIPDGIEMPVDLAPFPSSRVGNIAAKALRKFGYLGLYDGVLKKSETTVIHAHFAAGGISALPVARRMRIPLVVTFHGKDVTADPNLGGRVGRRYRRNLRELFHGADLLLAVSDHIRRKLLELGAPEEKIVVHRIGIPLSEAVATVDRKGIVLVGRFVEKKGVDDLLRAVAHLPYGVRQSTPVKIVGYGPLDSSLREQARQLGLDTVEFLGRLGSAEVASILRGAAVLCAPSKTASNGDTEGLPISLLEAALHGAGIVSTNHAGIPEFVQDGETGLLSEEGDVLGLSRNLMKMLTDDEFRVGATARMSEVLRRDYDIETQTIALENLYDEISQRHSGGARSATEGQ